MTKKRIGLYVGILLLGTLLTGCGKDKELEAYEASMNTFYENINALNEELNAIDPASETSTVDLLACLDKIDAEFNTLSDITIPERYSQASEFAAAAITNMDQSVSLYHDAFAGDAYDDTIATQANDYYVKANNQIRYIAQVMSAVSSESSTTDSTEASTEETTASNGDSLDDNFDEDDDTVFYNETTDASTEAATDEAASTESAE